MASEIKGYQNNPIHFPNTPTSLTAPDGDSSNKLATTEFVDRLINKRYPIGSIGKAGQAGFGIGVAPENIDLSLRGLTPILGHDDPMSDTYGNYLHTEGSVMCFIPKFFYRIGSSDSPVFNRFGANSIDIVGSETFSNEAEANAAGYTLHRAFIDGGVEQDGFFYDKYYNSKNPSNVNTSISVKGGIPISLTTDTGYTRSQGMTGCVGQLLDAFPLVKARGDNFFVTTIFMRSALAMISLCHGQYATGPSFCAWYDSAGNTNYPKGANANNLRDADDTEVLYTSAGDSGAGAKPRTGSGIPFNKTTHNGQGCGVADLNGCMWEVNIGITRMGTAAGSSATTGNDDLFVLKESEKAGDLTNGWNGPTDAWGTEANLLLKYDKVEHQIPQATTGWGIKWGNGGQQVLSSSMNGTSRALCGVIPDLPSQVSATGINLFGVDGIYRYRRQNLFVQSGGSWGNAAEGGFWSRSFSVWRARSSYDSSFRAASF